MIFTRLDVLLGGTTFAVQVIQSALPLGLFFGLILVTLTSTTLNPEIKRLVRQVVNIMDLNPGPSLKPFGEVFDRLGNDDKSCL